MRAIDADKLYDKLLYDTTHTFMVHGGGQYIASFRVADAIDKAPTIYYTDLVPHGRWEFESNTVTDYISGYRCSICKTPKWLSHDVTQAFNFCPSCGARMDGEKESE